MKTIPSKFKPFLLVTKDDTKKVIIVAGRCQACPQEFNSEKDAEEYLRKQPYEMFINLYSIIKHYENEDQKEISKNVEKNA